ncbi:MAG: formylglycine-generating enzyme family protein [Planctomycetales bacterium]|nr:formylglycine-generating enzyme family protein [Planctomycetales bacterium]
MRARALRPGTAALLACAACASAPPGPTAPGAGPGERVRALDGMPVIPVPAGPFVSGDERPDLDEPEPHRETTGAYWIDKYEVTNGQFARFLDAQRGDVSPFLDPTVPGLVREGGRWAAAPGRERHPVAAATWHGAVAYARWIGGRLPTDIEWEKAARGTDGRSYPWGEETPDGTFCNFLQAGLDDTSPVGSFPKGASPYGAMDMAGNVYERVLTARGPGSIRSGGFVCPMAWQMRASDRCGYALDRSHPSVGFRCVMDAPPRE